MLLFLYCAGGLSARASGLDLRSRGPAGLRAEREERRPSPRRRPPTKPPSHAACQQPVRAFLCWVPRSCSLFFVHSVSHSLDFFCVCVSSVRACACVRVCLVFSFESLTLCLRELERGMPPSAQASTTPYTHQALSRLGRVPFSLAQGVWCTPGWDGSSENVTFLRRKASVPLRRALGDASALSAAMAALG